MVLCRLFDINMCLGNDSILIGLKRGWRRWKAEVARFSTAPPESQTDAYGTMLISRKRHHTLTVNLSLDR